MNPFSTSTLANLLDILGNAINTPLDFIDSVLDMPSLLDSPVRLLHLSFRNFLIDPLSGGENRFWVDE